jgi:DNA-binding IscR family transcriptional regulator
VFRAVEGPLEPVECPRSTDCPSLDVCISRHTWSELYKEITGFIDSVTLQDLTEAFRAADKEDYVI